MALHHTEPTPSQKSTPTHSAVVISRKGGVGKTSLVRSLALRMASRGMQVGVLDADICCPTIHEYLLPTTTTTSPPLPSSSSSLTETTSVTTAAGSVQKPQSKNISTRPSIRYGQKKGWLPVSIPVPAPLGSTDTTNTSEASESGSIKSSVQSPGSLKLFSVAMLLSDTDTVASFAWLPHRKRLLIDQFMQNVVWGKLDVLLIDTPPSNGEVHAALLDRLQSTTGAVALLVAQDNNAGSLFATKSDIFLCASQKIAIAGIVATKCRFKGASSPTFQSRGAERMASPTAGIEGQAPAGGDGDKKDLDKVRTRVAQEADVEETEVKVAKEVKENEEQQQQLEHSPQERENTPLSMLSSKYNIPVISRLDTSDDVAVQASALDGIIAAVCKSTS